MQKFIFTLFFLCTFIVLAQAQKKDSINVKKYPYMVEINMNGLFGYGAGNNLIFRKKKENSRFVYVNRTHFWRFGLYLNGNANSNNLPDSIYVGNTSYSYWFNDFTNQDYVNISPSIGYETLFHFGRFGLFYALELAPFYYYSHFSARDYYNGRYVDYKNNSFGMSFRAYGGARLYLNERFSLSLESMPLSITGFADYQRYIYTNINNKIPYRDIGLTFNQSWLSSLGLSYSF